MTAQSMEVSRDYASCLRLMRKVSALPREWDRRPLTPRVMRPTKTSICTAESEEFPGIMADGRQTGLLLSEH